MESLNGGGKVAVFIITYRQSSRKFLVMGLLLLEEGARGVTVIVVRSVLGYCIPHRANTLGKGLNLVILSPAIDKL